MMENQIKIITETPESESLLSLLKLTTNIVFKYKYAQAIKRATDSLIFINLFHPDIDGIYDILILNPNPMRILEINIPQGIFFPGLPIPHVYIRKVILKQLLIDLIKLKSLECLTITVLHLIDHIVSR